MSELTEKLLSLRREYEGSPARHFSRRPVGLKDKFGRAFNYDSVFTREVRLEDAISEDYPGLVECLKTSYQENKDKFWKGTKRASVYTKNKGKAVSPPRVKTLSIEDVFFSGDLPSVNADLVVEYYWHCFDIFSRIVCDKMGFGEDVLEYVLENGVTCRRSMGYCPNNPSSEYRLYSELKKFIPEKFNNISVMMIRLDREEAERKIGMMFDALRVDYGVENPPFDKSPVMGRLDFGKLNRISKQWGKFKKEVTEPKPKSKPTEKWGKDEYIFSVTGRKLTVHDNIRDCLPSPVPSLTQILNPHYLKTEFDVKRSEYEYSLRCCLQRNGVVKEISDDVEPAWFSEDIYNLKCFKAISLWILKRGEDYFCRVRMRTR